MINQIYGRCQVEVLLLEHLLFPLISCVLPLCIVHFIFHLFVYLLFSTFVFFLPPWGIVYSPFSSLGFLEFQFLVGTPILETFHIWVFITLFYIWVPSYVCLNQGPTFKLLIFFTTTVLYVHVSILKLLSPWYTTLCISKYSSVNSSISCTPFLRI